MCSFALREHCPEPSTCNPIAQMPGTEPHRPDVIQVASAPVPKVRLHVTLCVIEAMAEMLLEDLHIIKRCILEDYDILGV